MAELKKNQTNQILFTMVKTDGVSIKSDLVASNITAKFYGVNHGSAAAAAATISRVPSLVFSGIFRHSLEASVCNYDYVLLNYKATSCLDQNLIFQMVTNDDSDMYSLLSDLVSDFQSRVPKGVATSSGVSDAISKLQSDLRSYLGGMSDVLSDFYSDFQSRVPKLVATASGLSDTVSKLTSDLKSTFANDASDIASAVWSEKYGPYISAALGSTFGYRLNYTYAAADSADAHAQYLSGVVSDFVSNFDSRVPKLILTNSAFDVGVAGLSALISNVQSNVSDFYSDFQSRVPKQAASMSMLSAFYSDFANRVNKEVASKSLLSDFYSDFQSRVPKIVATASGVSDALSKLQSNMTSEFGADLSDMASAVWTEKYYTSWGSSTFGSAFRLMYSRVSDIQSHLSDVQSDLKSQIGALDLALDASDVSNIVAQILAGGVATAAVLSDFYSDFQSRVPKLVANNSQLAKAQSVLYEQADATDNYLATMSGVLSDATSAAQQVNSRVLYANSMLSQLYNAGVALNTATLSDIRSMTQAVTATIDTSAMSDIASRVWSAKYTNNSVASSFGSLFSVIGTKATGTYSSLSDFKSDFGSKVPKAVATASVLSDFYSDFGSRVPKAVATASVLSDFYSDFGSRVPKLVATNSQLSDLHSDLRSYLAGMSDVLSDFYSDFTSKVTATIATAAALSDFHSDFQSRVPKLVATNSQLSDLASDLKSALGGISVALAASDITKITSQVLAGGVATAASLANVYSMLSDFQSDFGSRVPKLVANHSQVSDLASDLIVMSGVQSDIYSLLSDFQSDFGSKVPKAVATASVLSDFYSDFQSRVPKAVATASAITAGVALTAAGVDAIWDEATSGHTTQGTYGELFAGVRANTAQAGAAGTITLDASASSTNDFYNGCLIKIVAGTGAGQRRWITDYVGSTKVATVDSNWITTPDGTSKFVIM